MAFHRFVLRPSKEISPSFGQFIVYNRVLTDKCDCLNNHLIKITSFAIIIAALNTFLRAYVLMYLSRHIHTHTRNATFSNGKRPPFSICYLAVEWPLFAVIFPRFSSNGFPLVIWMFEQSFAWFFECKVVTPRKDVKRKRCYYFISLFAMHSGNVWIKCLPLKFRWKAFSLVAVVVIFLASILGDMQYEGKIVHRGS